MSAMQMLRSEGKYSYATGFNCVALPESRTFLSCVPWRVALLWHKNYHSLVIYGVVQNEHNLDVISCNRCVSLLPMFGLALRRLAIVGIRIDSYILLFGNIKIVCNNNII